MRRRQELEQSIQALEEHLRVLSKDGGGALLVRTSCVNRVHAGGRGEQEAIAPYTRWLQVPQGLALAPQHLVSSARPAAPLSEGARIKMLQQGPKIM